MPKTIQRVGVLTGGGDCPGINAVIRAVTKTAIYRYKARVFGIEDGFLGLVENRVGELTSMHVSGILTRGGTILGTNNRCNPTRYYTGDDKDGKPIFAGSGYADLSDTALHYIGGIMAHAKALNAFVNPTTNSYKRLIPGFEAPVLLAYSARNRSAGCRIPFVTSPAGKRVEVRFPDPACNPYLALSAYIMAGLDGIRRELDPGEPNWGNLFDLGLPEIRRRGIPLLPQTLVESLAELKQDKLVQESLGVIYDELMELKLGEWREFHRQVTPWEIQQYLTLF